MEELLTAKQVQEVLKIDRTTIYRMLKDGRLVGVKVGNQWRFSVGGVQELLAGSQPEFNKGGLASADILTWKYVQSVQDVFAEMADIGCVITDCQGVPLTRMSNSCDFCNLILRSDKGKKACLRSWQQLANQTGDVPEFKACHAGLQYARARITVCGETFALLVAGQFCAEGSEPTELEPRIKALAQQYQIDPNRLTLAAGRIRVLNQRLMNQLSRWLSQMARTLEQFGMERAELLSRLHQIAEMSMVE